MSTDPKRALIAVVRKIVFAGLVLLIAWLVLLGLRGTISVDTINQMREQATQLEEMEQKIEIPLNPWSWDWSKSIWRGIPVAEITGERLWPTLGYVSVISTISLLLAMIFLFVGQIVSRVTTRPGWLVKSRGILRLIIISAAVGIPIFVWDSLLPIYPAVWWKVPLSESGNPATFVLTMFIASSVPIWLLVQYGHGELAKWPETSQVFDGELWRHLAISLVIKILKLVGLIIVISMFVGLSSNLSGMGRIFVDAVAMRDLPVMFGVVWTIIIMVVLLKLAADIIEITYNHFRQKECEEGITTIEKSAGFKIPRWLLVTCLILVASSLIVAIIGFLISPHGTGNLTLADRLVPPSLKHIMGTDNLGRDIFSKLIFAIGGDVMIGLLAMSVMIPLVVGWGILGAHVRKPNDWRGDTLEDIVMLPRDVLYACPWLILLLLLMSLAGYPIFGLFSGGIALFAGLVLLPRAMGIVQEAYHNPPQQKKWLEAVLLSLPVVFLFTVSGGMIYVSAATYLGFGIAPPSADLGGMLTGPGRRYMLEAPWMALWPPTVLIFLMTVWVMTGDVLLERLGFRSKSIWSKILE